MGRRRAQNLRGTRKPKLNFSKPSSQPKTTTQPKTERQYSNQHFKTNKNTETKTTAPPPTNVTPQTTHQAPSGGSGLLGNFVSTAAGVFAGNALARTLFGATTSDGSSSGKEPCSEFSLRFLECLQNNKTDISVCQSSFDSLNACRAENSLMGKDEFYIPEEEDDD